MNLTFLFLLISILAWLLKSTQITQCRSNINSSLIMLPGYSIRRVFTRSSFKFEDILNSKYKLGNYHSPQRFFSSSVMTALVTLLCSQSEPQSCSWSVCICVRNECVSVCGKEERKRKGVASPRTAPFLSLSLFPLLSVRLLLLSAQLLRVICFWNYFNDTAILLSHLINCMCHMPEQRRFSSTVWSRLVDITWIN